MAIVVTGGAGFIGSHLCANYLLNNYEVICVDNLITGHEENIERMKEKKNFTFLPLDVAEPGWAEYAARYDIDTIFHFASPASPQNFKRLSREIMSAGSQGTRQCLDLAASMNATFVLASTSEVYGDPAVSPQPESYWGNVNPIGHRAVYDEAKRFAEAMTMAASRDGVDTSIVRIFNTYGPRMPQDGRAIPTFFKQALRGQPVTIHGDGTHTRSFTYVSDLIEGIRAMVRVPYHEPINLGSDCEITVLEAAQKVIKVCQSKSEISFKEGDLDDPCQRKPDITRAREILDWKPKVDFEEGLYLSRLYFEDRVTYRRK